MLMTTIALTTLTLCVGLQSTASAQGIPDLGPTALQQNKAAPQSLQAQVASVQGTGSQAEKMNALLVQLLGGQKQTLSELASIDQHLAMSEATQRAAVDTARQQFNLQVSSQSHDHLAQ